jgi:hypothetical protein
MNPSFYERMRYDCALVAVVGGFIIARLIGIFGISYSGRDFLFALILPFDEPCDRSSATIRKRDDDLIFTRVRSRQLHKSTFVPLESLVRGALVVPDAACRTGDEFIIVDVVDADFWLRMRTEKLAGSLCTKCNV